MCFDESEQLFWRIYNSSTTMYYRDYHVGADINKPGAYYAQSASYFAEPGHPRLNYGKTEVFICADCGTPTSEDASVRAKASQPLSVVAEAAKQELCMNVKAPLEPDSHPCCIAEGKNEDGHWCCESGSLSMCLDDTTQMFWRTFNSSTTFYYHEWYLAAPTSNRESYYIRGSNYFAEPDHPRLNFASTEIIVSPVSTHEMTVV